MSLLSECKQFIDVDSDDSKIKKKTVGLGNILIGNLILPYSVLQQIVIKNVKGNIDNRNYIQVVIYFFILIATLFLLYRIYESYGGKNILYVYGILFIVMTIYKIARCNNITIDLSKVSDAARSAGGAISDAASSAGGAISDVTGDAGGAISDATEDVGGAVSGVAEDAGGAIGISSTIIYIIASAVLVGSGFYVYNMRKGSDSSITETTSPSPVTTTTTVVTKSGGSPSPTDTSPSPGSPSPGSPGSPSPTSVSPKK